MKALTLAWCGVFSILTSLSGTSALAQTRVSEEDVERSKQLFAAGRELLELGNCRDAVVKLEESLRLNESVGARLSLARCSPNDPLEAWRQLKQAELLAATKGDERVAFARGQAAGLEPRLALIRVEVAPSVRDLAGFELRIDRAPVDPFLWRAGTIAVEPGTHILEASVPDTRSWRREINAFVGGMTVVRVALEDDVATTAVKAGPLPPTEGSTQRVIGLAIGGLGTLGMGLGAVFGVLAQGAFDDAKAACGPRYPACDGNGRDASAKNDSAFTRGTVSTIAFVAGGALLATGALVYFTSAKVTKARVAVAPALGGVDLMGTW